MKRIPIVMLASFAAAAVAAQPPITFKQAVTMVTSTKGCKEPNFVGPIASAHIADPAMMPPSRGIFLQVQSDDPGVDDNIVGPLKTRPTDAEFKSLKGKPTCWHPG